MSCPVCCAEETYVFFDGGRIRIDSTTIGSSRTNVRPGCILRCTHCGLGFTRERLTEEQLEGLYRHMDVSVYELEAKGRRRTAEKHLSIVSRHISKGKLLDVGCASGVFIELAQDAGWLVAGIEPSKALFDKARQRLTGQCNLQAKTLQQSHFSPASFDVVTLWDVLEHVDMPVSFLKHCHSLLKPGGFIFINVPNLDSWSARLLRSRWPLLLPEHLNYFNSSSLRCALQHAGFDCISMSRRSSNFSLAYLLYRLDQHGWPGSRSLRNLALIAGLGTLVLPMYIGETLAIARVKRTI